MLLGQLAFAASFREAPLIHPQTSETQVDLRKTTVHPRLRTDALEASLTLAKQPNRSSQAALFLTNSCAPAETVDGQVDIVGELSRRVR